MEPEEHLLLYGLLKKDVAVSPGTLIFTKTHSAR